MCFRFNMSGESCEAMIDETVLEKLYIFAEEFFDSFTANLITYFYVLRQVKNSGNQIKAFTISGKSLPTASCAFNNSSARLGKLVNELQAMEKVKTLKMTHLENWIIDVNRRSSRLKKTLLETSLDIFQAYEMLLMNNANEIPKYADEAAKKMLKHFVSPDGKSVADTATITDIITRSENGNRTIIQCSLGSLLTELLKISPDEKKNSVEKYFSSVGIWYNGTVYVNHKSKPKKYFYRRLFTTEKNEIPDGYLQSDFDPKTYNYLLDPKDLDNVLVRLEDHFRRRDINKIETKLKDRIASIKSRISEEQQEICASYRLDVLEDLTDAMNEIENIADKADKEEEEEDKAASSPSNATKITNVKSTKIGTWNARF